MATKKPTTGAKKPAAKTAKTKATPVQAARKARAAKKPASKKEAPVILTPPKRKTAAKTVKPEVVDAEVVSTSAPPSGPTTAQPEKPVASAMPKPDSPNQNAGTLPSGSLIKFGVIAAAAIIVIAIAVSVVGRLTRGPAAVVASAASVEALQIDNEARLARLENAIAGLDGGADTAALEDVQKQMKNLRAALNLSDAKVKSKLKNADESLLSLQARLDTVEARLQEPAVDGGDGLSMEAQDLLARYDQDLQKLQAELAAQQKANAGLAAELKQVALAQSDLTATQAEIVTLAEESQGSNEGAELSVALAGLAGAIENGGAYGTQIARIEMLSGATVAKSLTDNAGTGVKPLYLLQQEFPDSARVALKIALQSQAGDGVASKLSAYIKSQISARSLQERPGDDPDAILSQAEAALMRGKLQLAVSLVKKLPDDAVAAMADWLEDAQNRLRAQTALKRLTASLGPDE